MTEEAPIIDHKEPETKPRPAASRRTAIAAVAGIALLAVGAVAGAGGTHLFERREAQSLLPPVAVSALSDGSVASVKGKVVEIYGNKFVIDDGTGKVLVETGPRGEGGKLVAQDETVTAQGRFEDGFMHGSMIVHGDDRAELLGPAGGPKHGPMKDWLRRF